MKKVYFAGKFNIKADESLPLCERLSDDFRARLLKDPSRLAVYTEGLKLSDSLIYSGPFYCEQASSGEFTSTDCKEVLSSEWDAVNSSDVYVALFGESFSVGTVVELGWAISADKDIYILYKKEESKYSISSEYWFAIVDAMRRAKRIKIFTYESDSEITEIIEREIICKK